MGTKHYRLLAINAALTKQETWFKREQQKDSYTLNVDEAPGIPYLRGRLRGLIREGYIFDNAVFTTHGYDGVIWFGEQFLSWKDWYSPEWYGVGFERLFPGSHTKIYFGGCNVAAGADGWKFLEASVRTLCRGSGGVSMGWTSSGFDWLPSGHMKHFWGSTRQVMLVGGDSLQFFEDWKRVDDGVNRPT